MSANKPAIRVARTQRMLAELGHSDIIDALRHAEEMRSALRVIYTWAGVDGEDLDHRQVRKLAAKALHMGANVKVTGAEPVLSAERPVDRRVGPPRRLRVCLACNDEHGIFAGRAWMAQPESLYRVGRHPWDAELVHDDWGRGVALTVDDKLMKLRIHRVWFQFKAHKTWHGNWCWDSFEFERSTGKRLLALMRDNGGWHCEAGPSKFYRWWNRRPNA